VGTLNVPQAEAAVINSIDTQHLSSLVAQCIRDEHGSGMRGLRLHECGPYVSARLYAFERALADYAAKSAAYSTRSRTLFRSDGGHRRGVVSDPTRHRLPGILAGRGDAHTKGHHEQDQTSTSTAGRRRPEHAAGRRRAGGEQVHRREIAMYARDAGVE
jgi:hypothetical protein